MKWLLLFGIVLVIFLPVSKAQLTADAGRDTTWCSNFIKLHLGGNPPSTGGMPPYQYSWSILESGFLPQTYLDSPDIANPRLIKGINSNALHFILSVTDANAITAWDTVTVWYAFNLVALADDCVENKYKSDTVIMRHQGAILSKFPLIAAHWSPSTYLSDPNIEHPKCWAPIQYFDYQFTTTDIKGCIFSNRCYVYVSPDPAIVGNRKLHPDEVLISPNPITSESILQVGATWLNGNFRLFSAEGRLITQQKLTAGQTRLQSLIPDTHGVLFYQIRDSRDCNLRYGKLTRN